MSQTSLSTPRHGPWVDIDLSNLCENYALLRDVTSDCEIAAVVKCNAYGLGHEKIAHTLSARGGCETFFVIYPEEGLALRETLADRNARIFCLAGQNDDTLPLFDQASLIPVLNSLEQAKHWASNRPGQEASLHVDTGINRMGAEQSAVNEIAALNSLNISLVMSHLACGSSPDHPLNRTQRERFVAAATHFPDARLSLGASAGALMDREYHFDMIRAGIALYGGSPFDEDDLRIKSVASLKAPIVQVRDIAAGEAVGYGATYTAKKPAKIATAALGYGDGYPRNNMPAGIALVSGARAPIAGRISMDFITIDITGLKKSVEPGDIAEFFGPNLRLTEASRITNRVAYDLLTGLGGRVDRRYL
ncbi:alanine racemase [Hyphococcus formosus]|uniref:alanine racemase n=1 Tax=Hyphococcus formosus TaxID=3143534 RepID=UPI00398B436F